MTREEPRILDVKYELGDQTNLGFNLGGQTKRRFDKLEAHVTVFDLLGGGGGLGKCRSVPTH